MQRRRQLENDLELDRKLGNAVGDLEAFFELANEGEDVAKDIQQELKRLEQDLGSIETATLLSGENAQCNAFLTIHPGAGGTESQDWAEMLL